MKDIDSPSGIDLRPEPPNPVRLSKRAGITGLVIVTAVIGLVGYGIATRRQRTAAAIERSDPSKLTAASDAGKAIAAEVPDRVIGGAAPALAPAEQLQVPGQTASRNGSQSGGPVVRPYPPGSPPPPVREPSAEEKALAIAYRQELE